MYSLFVDQSSGEGLFALFCNGRVLEVQHRVQPEASHPCAILHTLLQNHGLSLSSIGFLACGVGPGSYTGIRSAAATVKGLAFSLHIPIVAVSSLLVLAPEQAGTYLLAADAKIGGVYVQEVSIDKGRCHALSPQVVQIEDLLKRLAIGPTLAVRSLEWLQKKGVDPARFASLHYREVAPSAAVVALAAYQEYEAGSYYTAASLPLLYLRKTQAEIDREEK